MGDGNACCLWDDSVCVDKPSHFISRKDIDGADAQVFCIRHYVLFLAHLCQIHLRKCPGDFDGHVEADGPMN